jgi:hypothetical protein
MRSGIARLDRPRDLREELGAAPLGTRGPDRQRDADGDREPESGPEDHERGREIDVEHGRRSLARSIVLATMALASWLAAAGAEAAEPIRYDVEASVDRGRGLVTMDVRIEVALDGTEDELRLWLFADRLAVAPAAMEERSWRWIYPGEIDLGGVVVSDATLDGAAVDGVLEPRAERDAGGSDFVVPIASGEARTAVVTLHAVLDVPVRFGRLG